MYILVRTKGTTREFLFDDFREPPKGYWGTRADYPSSLPLTFKDYDRALHRFYREQNLDPTWVYVIDEYLR